MQGKAEQACAGKAIREERMRQRNRQKKKKGGGGQDSGEMQSSKGSVPSSGRDLCKSCVNPLLNPGSWQLSCKGSWQLSRVRRIK